MTQPQDPVEAKPRDRRPLLVELAAALLVVTGTVQLVSALGLVVTGNLEPGAEGLLALAIALDVATIAAGLLTRAGRLWLLVVNYVAVLGFLDLLRLLQPTASPVALMLTAVDLFALFVLFTNRSWFQRRTAADDANDANDANDDAAETEPTAD